MGNVVHGAQQLTANPITILDTCDSYAGWAVGTAATDNLTTVPNHVEGSAALSFDKIAGATTAAIARSLKNSHRIEPDRVSDAAIRVQSYIPDITDVVAVHVDLGQNASNYSRFTFPATKLKATTWFTVEELLRERGGGYAGTGLITDRIEWVRITVEFGDPDTEVAGILIDGIVIAEFEGGGVSGESSSVSIDADTVGLAKESTLGALNGKVSQFSSETRGALKAVAVEVVDASGNQITAFGADPVGLKNTGATPINPATEDTLATRASETTVASILAKIIAAPATEATVGTLATEATVATLALDSTLDDIRDNVLGDINTNTNTQSDTVNFHDEPASTPGTQVGGRYESVLTDVSLTGDFSRFKTDIKGRQHVILSAESVGLATGAKQDTVNTNTGSINGKLGTLGQKAMTGSAPVVLPTDQSAIPVMTQDGAGVPITSGGAYGVRGLHAVIADADGEEAKTDGFGNLRVRLWGPGAATPVEVVDGRISVDSDIKANTIGIATGAKQDIGNLSLGNVDTNTGNLQNTHGTVHTTAPTRVVAVGGRYNAVIGVPLDEGDIAHFAMTKDKRIITENKDSATWWSYRADFAVGQTNLVLKAAPGAGLRNRILGYTMSANAAVNFAVQDEDDAIVLGTKYLTAKQTIQASNCDYRVTANKALELDTDAAVAHSIDIYGDVVPA